MSTYGVSVSTASIRRRRKKLLKGRGERVRAVATGPDGLLYVLGTHRTHRCSDWSRRESRRRTELSW